jgi:hypothetical protein
MDGSCHLPWRTTPLVPFWGRSITECTLNTVISYSYVTQGRHGLVLYSRPMPSLWSHLWLCSFSMYTRKFYFLVGLYLLCGIRYKLVPLTVRWMVCEVWGVEETWHSYSPESDTCGDLQSSNVKKGRANVPISFWNKTKTFWYPEFVLLKTDCFGLVQNLLSWTK